MIPQTIHYCWFGHNPKPKIVKKCIRSWKKHCKGWQIIEWNESNYDISAAPLYVRQAYESKKYAFVSDYVRLQVVYEHGGVYLDTDVELIKNPAPLMQYNAYFGFEESYNESEYGISTGLGFGAVAGASIIKELINDYKDKSFILENGKPDLTPCPLINMKVFQKYCTSMDNKLRITDDNMAFLPFEYLNPFSYKTRLLRITKNTYSIHWSSATWLDKEEKKQYRLYVRRNRTLKIKRMIRNILLKIKK